VTRCQASIDTSKGGSPSCVSVSLDRVSVPMEEQALQTLRYGRMPQADKLHASGKQQERVGEALPVHEAITYLENHGERMGDAHARQRGQPIRSGTVEASCKSLVALRMKRPGARGKQPSGQHILDLRALVLSDHWSSAMPLVLAPLRSRVHAAA